MKYEVGDKIIILLTNEDGRVVEIINEKMVMIEVKGVHFPAYMDQIDFPYFKMFSEKKVPPPKKIYVDNVKREKKLLQQTQKGKEVFISFLPVFNKDIFDDDVVEKLKIYLVNGSDIGYNFTYNLIINGEVSFQINNTLLPSADFYLHDVKFEDLSDNPRFNVEFSLVNQDKRKAPFYATSLKLKAKQLFKKIEEIKLKNEPTFSYIILQDYPDKEEEDKIDLNKLSNAGYKIYDANKIKDNLPPPRTVVDLHIDKLTDKWQQFSNFEILALQLKTFEKYYDLAVAHKQPSLTIIHGVGTGRLKDEIHEVLRLKKEVKSFVNQYHALYGYGATEIFFN